MHEESRGEPKHINEMNQEELLALVKECAAKKRELEKKFDDAKEAQAAHAAAGAERIAAAEAEVVGAEFENKAA